jgi:type I restriction enzyme M protein
MTSTTEEGNWEQELSYNRQDFWASTSNKQLNFLQHIKPNWRLPVKRLVLPDNVLFEGGAGEAVRKNWRPPSYTPFCACLLVYLCTGVKANVLFFNNKPASKEAWTKDVDTIIGPMCIIHQLESNANGASADFIDVHNTDNRHKEQKLGTKKILTVGV